MKHTVSVKFIVFFLIFVVLCVNARYLNMPGFYGHENSDNVMGKAADVFSHGKHRLSKNLGYYGILNQLPAFMDNDLSSMRAW